MAGVRQMFRLIYNLYIWLIAIPLVFLSTVFFGSLCLAIAPFIGPRRAGSLCGVPWARFGLLITGTSVEVNGREHIQPQQSYVIVANHLSLYDIWVLYGHLGMDFRWVAKQELRRVPIVGRACEVLGHVFIDRSDSPRARASLEQARQQIVHGTCILFFPEGTRSRDGRIQPFKKGAFRMAVDMQLPVLPLTINNTQHILPPDGLRQTPGKAEILIHPPVPADTDAERLLNRSRAAIIRGLSDAASDMQTAHSPE